MRKSLDGKIIPWNDKKNTELERRKQKINKEKTNKEI